MFKICESLSSECQQQILNISLSKYHGKCLPNLNILKSFYHFIKCFIMLKCFILIYIVRFHYIEMLTRFHKKCKSKKQLR